MRTTAPNQPLRGMTLTEVLVALAIFMVGSVGIMALFAAAGQRSAAAEQTLNFTLLLDSVANDLEAEPDKYALPRQAENGYPDELLEANGGTLPDDPRDLLYPADWVQPLNGRYYYTVWLEPLPDTRVTYPSGAEGEPQLLIARITVFYTRENASTDVPTRTLEKVIANPRY